jgi:CubicO group peptidase (beta-lactamase class C family)
MLTSAALLVGLATVAAAAQAPTVDARLAAAQRAATSLNRLHSLVVSQHGAVRLEYYARGYHAQRLANIKSASKSVISALVGIAVDRKLIPSVHVPIATWFPVLQSGGDPRKAAITVDDLLTMRSGLETTSNRNYGAWVTSPNWVRFVLTRQLVAEPGTTMQYSTGSTHLLSSILSTVSKSTTWQFAQSVLGRPLGFALAQWPRDPQGVYFGGNDMLLTPRQMLAFGELFLHEGAANSQQVVPSSWVRESCVPKTTSRFDAGREYGYGWWIDEVGGHRTCYAWGYGGQYIFVFRDLDAVVVTTSSTATDDQRRSYRRALLDLIGTQVLPSLE